MKTNIFLGLCFNILLCITFPTHAQTTENVLIKANALYEGNKFKEALPLLEQVYKEKPADAEIALKYGVSLCETKQNLDKAITLLSEASKKKQTEAYLYLGDVYTELYRFSDASKEYDQYAKLKKKDSHALSVVGRKTEEMNELKKLVARTENIQIIDSIIINKGDLLSAYKLSSSCGRLAYFKDVFTSNMNIESTVYYNEKGSKIYFSQPEDGLYTLFTMDKLLDGFGNERKMDADNFGLTQNINYVFVMPDGITTYFAAEDANGIGGYDLYVTRYNINTNTYLAPERLNMPFNSRYNDYMMVIDEEKGIGWFATDRFMDNGKVCVYTFIPNKEVEIVESGNETFLASRALVSSIKDSWRTDKDYSKLINLAKKETIQKIEIVPDFEFIINDQNTYHSYSDFKNPTAKNIYTKAREKIQLLDKTESDLSKARDNYIKASAADKERLSPEILRLEQLVDSLKREIDLLEINARNEEIKTLR